MQNFLQQRHVPLGRKLIGYVERSGAEVVVVHLVLEARGDGTSQTVCGRWISGSEVSVPAILEPVRNPADIKSRNGYAASRGLESNKSERLGPDARHDEQI